MSEQNAKSFNEISENTCLNSNSFDENTDNKLLNSALHYAKLGYAVFPLHNLITDGEIARCSCRGWQNCNRIAKHPRTRNGHTDATTNEKRVREWWQLYPNANIGLSTGFQTNLFVLDIDIKSGGEQSLEFLQEDYKALLRDKYEHLPATLTTITGSGGRHLYFNFPLGLKNISSSASEIADGLDIRANGGYVVAPPSNHKNGNYYSWFGVNTPIENAPNWLIYELVKSEKPVVKSNKVISEKISKSGAGGKIAEGKRHTYLFKQVSGLINSYLKEEVLRRAIKINDELFEVPLPESEVLRLVDYVCKKYKNSK